MQMINQITNNYVLRHEKVLNDLLTHLEIPAPRIREAMMYSLFPGGKRLRPTLVYLSGELINIHQNSLDMIAAAIELTHCYSLIHDDLPAMDNDDFRRGKPSCHRAFDEATAILAGDGLQAFAIDILLTNLPRSLDMQHVVEVVRELVRASGPTGMVSGQSLDLTELANPLITEAKLREIHMLKTGQLMLTCINMVLVAGKATSSEMAALRQFASHLGLFFQMQDDYLDQYGKIEQLGKGRASDAANQKTTFATLFSQNHLSALISEQVQQAQTALTLFGARADHLNAFLLQLHLRSNH